jgi:hypothetical protein
VGMVVRPSDWFLVGLPVDPTPGDAFGIRALAGKYGEIAQIAGDASTGVRHARSSGAASAWVGDAGDIFRDKSQRMPGELAKANDSYELVAEALRAWAAALDDTQAQADRGLQQAREAHHDLSRAQAALTSAEWSWTTAHAQQLTYQTLTKAYTLVPPPPGVKMPTDYQLRSVDRSAQQAQASIASAKHAIADADARLAAARALVLEAKERRDDAERTAVHQIAQAGDHAVKPSSIWEAITDSAAWEAIITIATVVLTIVSIVAIFVGGPLVWALIIAATVLLLADALMKAAQGQDMTMTIVLLLVGLIPGGRALTSVAKIAEVFRSGSSVAHGVGLVGIHLASVSKGALVTTINSLRKSAMGLVPGITSAVRSFPAELSAMVGSAREGKPVVEFVKDMVGGVKNDYSVAADNAWNNHLLTMNDDPARVATLWQSGGGAYHDADVFGNTMSHPGQIFEQGLGGATSNFFLADGSSASKAFDLNAVADGGQIGRSGPEATIRADMVRWMTPGSEPMATATVSANTAFGHGGLTEGFFTDIAVKVSEGRVVPISVQTGLPLHVEWKVVTNKAMDIFGAHPWLLDVNLADKIPLTGDPSLGRTVAEEAASFGRPGLMIGFRLLESALGASYTSTSP